MWNAKLFTVETRPIWLPLYSRDVTARLRHFRCELCASFASDRYCDRVSKNPVKLYPNSIWKHCIEISLPLRPTVRQNGDRRENTKTQTLSSAIFSNGTSNGWREFKKIYIYKRIENSSRKLRKSLAWKGPNYFLKSVRRRRRVAPMVPLLVLPSRVEFVVSFQSSRHRERRDEEKKAASAVVHKNSHVNRFGVETAVTGLTEDADDSHAPGRTRRLPTRSATLPTAQWRHLAIMNRDRNRGCAMVVILWIVITVHVHLWWRRMSTNEEDAGYSLYLCRSTR